MTDRKHGPIPASALADSGKPAGRIESRCADEEPELTNYSSPPCFMHELDDATLGYLARGELLALLNELLEAERAGAKVVGHLSGGAPDPAMAKTLHAVAQDEGRFCAMLLRQIARLGGIPSQATGRFHDKVMALPNWSARVDLLNRGQSWVVRKLRDAVPRIRDEALRRDLQDMCEVHERNIRSCGGQEVDR